MKLHIVTPGSRETLDIVWLEVDTNVGNFVILKDHAPMVLGLKPGSVVAYCLKNSKQDCFQVKRALAEITPTNVTIILNEKA